MSLKLTLLEYMYNYFDNGILFIGFFEGYLIYSINKMHSSLNIFKALGLSLVL